MSRPNQSEARSQTTVMVVEAGGRHSLAEVAEQAGVQPEQLRRWHRAGLLAAAGGDHEPEFDDNAIYEVRRIEYYRREHGVSARSLPVVLDLLREVERLHAELRARR